MAVLNSSTIHTAPPPNPYTPIYLAVSHRPSVIQWADQLIVLEAGQVILSGLPYEFDAGNLIGGRGSIEP
ncbi:MAG: hypothetical protein AAF215_21025 [Cyanobacteria bacterium P01_A01_bin.123]